MPTEPAQQVLVVFELGLFLGGLVLFFWVLGNSTARQRWLGTNALPGPISVTDFALIAVSVFLFCVAFQSAAQLLLGPRLEDAADKQGLTLFFFSVANYTGALVAWKLAFPSLRRTWLGEPDAPPPLARPASLPWASVLRYGAGTLMLALPLLSLTSLTWNFVIQQLDLPVTPQDVIAIFTNTKSPWVIGGMLLVACVFAPIFEELVFRAGIYRFCRHRLGRGWALVISGCAFGALHANWAGFLPLALLGMGLAIAYEATGSIRVTIVAHGLFNLNTVLILLSGLPVAGQ